MGGERRVLVGVTGGIAAYKVPPLIRLLRKSGCEVKVVLTQAAKPLVGVEALRALSGSRVYADGGSAHYDMDHIRLSEWAGAYLICPATANTIAKMAAGIADNLLTTLTLSIPEKKILVAPAMNCVMWANKATQSNIAALASRGVTVLPVGEGELACGVRGPGRMLGLDEIVRRTLDVVDNAGAVDGAGTVCAVNTGDGVDAAANADGAGGTVDADINQDISTDVNPDVNPDATLSGKSVLISSGPTEEPIDPVRVITNRSSGKMGAALAKAALSMGAKVAVVSGPAAEPLPFGAEAVYVRTAAEMSAAMAERFASADICVMAAAVSDYRPVSPSKTKIHRNEKKNIAIELAPTPDILEALGAAKAPGQVLVGFSLESEDNIDRAEAKMRKKRCDMMVFNRVDTSLGGNDTVMTLLFADGGREAFPAMGKAAAAEAIMRMAGSHNATAAGYHPFL